ncbi:MAG: transposase [Anaerolineaceae bacterium]|nr:MAG: transposase [Anaerolineaceae bacterium]
MPSLPTGLSWTPLRQHCSRAKSGGRTLTIYLQEQYEALMEARKRQKIDGFKEMYGERAGIEGTISQGVRKMGLRRSRYVGLSRTHLQHVATAAAINVVRVVNWLAGEEPEQTRVSSFQALEPI